MNWPNRPTSEPEKTEVKQVEPSRSADDLPTASLTADQLKQMCKEALDKARPVHQHTPLEVAVPSDGTTVMLSGAHRRDN